MRRWYQPSADEGCFEAGLATLLGVPPALLPDFTGQSTGEALDSLEVWAARRNWSLRRHLRPS